MKKQYTILPLLAALTLAACAGGAETQPVQAAPAPLELLQTVWDAIPEEGRFPSMGGAPGETLQEGPGALDMENTDYVSGTLLVPQEQLSHIVQAASVTHMLNVNTFTCGAFQLEGVTASEFAVAMEKSVGSHRWLCGFPDRLVIAVFGEDTALSVFGRQETVTAFLDALDRCYADRAVIAVDKPLP